jgi:hypothetical protein
MTAATSATPTAAASMQHPNAGTPEGTPVIDRLAINTLRTLAMDAVKAAKTFIASMQATSGTLYPQFPRRRRAH